MTWGQGPERLSIFHETTGEEERQEELSACRWQEQKWETGFGWITGPKQHGGRGLAPRFERLFRSLEAAFDVPDMNPIRIGISTVAPGIVACAEPDR